MNKKGDLDSRRWIDSLSISEVGRLNTYFDNFTENIEGSGMILGEYEKKLEVIIKKFPDFVLNSSYMDGIIGPKGSTHSANESKIENEYTLNLLKSSRLPPEVNMTKLKEYIKKRNELLQIEEKVGELENKLEYYTLRIVPK